MDLSQLGATAGFMTAFVAVWRVFAERRATRSSGKRLSYSFAIASGSTKKANLLLRWFPGLRRRMARSASKSGGAMEALVFLWNSGTETITREDFFLEKLLRIATDDARIVSASIDLQSFAAVGTSVRLVDRLCSTEWASKMSRAASSAEIIFSYLPPDHGAIIRIGLRDLRRRVPTVSVIGPIRGLKKITFAGVVVSLPLDNPMRLAKIGRWIEHLVNASLAGMGAVVVLATASGVFGSGGFSSRYWATMGGTLFFEVIYLISRDIRTQIMYRIPSRLAFWDRLRCERAG
jgi:hypothetical protein